MPPLYFKLTTDRLGLSSSTSVKGLFFTESNFHRVIRLDYSLERRKRFSNTCLHIFNSFAQFAGMASRVVFEGVCQFLYKMPGKRNKRVSTTFSSRAGELISVLPNSRHSEKLDTTASRKPGERPRRKLKTFRRASLANMGRDLALEEHVTTRHSWRSESRPMLAPGRTPLKQIRSGVKVIVRKLRNSLRRFREMAKATNLQICDLFPNNRMLMHVTATPLCRAKVSSSWQMKHQPSPGIGRSLPHRSSCFE